MQDEYMSHFFREVVLREILPTIADTCPTATAFAPAVLDRFANPFIAHKLISITFQESSKMNARNVRTLVRYYEKYQTLPPHLCLGFATMLLFLQPTREEGGKYYGNRGAEEYVITDDNAPVFAAWWRDHINIKDMVTGICSDKRLWETDLTAIPGFAEQVADHLSILKSKGVKAFIQSQLLKN